LSFNSALRNHAAHEVGAFLPHWSDPRIEQVCPDQPDQQEADGIGDQGWSLPLFSDRPRGIPPRDLVT
jgi:hypothetical protein